MPTGLDLVALARTHIGERYDLGASPPKDNPGWKGPWDCAEFASWLVYQTTGRLYGCDNNAGSPARADAYTGFWSRDAHTMGTLVTVAEAARTPGAFLLRPPGAAGKAIGHIALSAGGGRTVEAMDRKHGVCEGSANGRSFTLGVIVHWIACESGPDTLVKPIHKFLDLGDKGAAVGRLQAALAGAGFDPGVMDDIFGEHTLAAVAAFQRAEGLVVDGVVGPTTADALGFSL